MARSMTVTQARAFVDGLAQRHVLAGDMPSEVALTARAATLSAATRSGRRPMTSRSLEAYFTKVAARRLVRYHGGTTAAARIVAERVVSDLVESGRTSREAYEELIRGWNDKLPGAVLEEYRERLCA